MKRVILLFGPHGLLGRQINESISKTLPDAQVLEISRSSKHSILEIPGQELAKTLHNSIVSSFYCQGPTDPQRPLEEHVRFHLEIPRAWYEWLKQNSDLKSFVTFGTVHEEHPLAEGNNYLQGKRRWKEFVEKTGQLLFHFRLHTVYGLPVPSHGFIGQMLWALRNKQDFAMSSGEQLREYHSVEDITEKILWILLKNHLSEGPHIFTLSHGKPISLRHLAEGVFEKLHPPVHLKVGALKSHVAEIKEKLWEATPEPYTPPYRDPIVGVSEVLKESLKSGGPS